MRCVYCWASWPRNFFPNGLYAMCWTCWLSRSRYSRSVRNERSWRRLGRVTWEERRRRKAMRGKVVT